MAGETLNLLNVRVHGDFLAEQTHFFCAVEYAAPQRTDRLITYEQYRRFSAP
ncbi:hypothetical protein SDC9_151166 [bioreactor metagenome]|uniref:Uncharacterized protein n=1 Tax=bioreactor metagenome TaxID=1076179 RepID=A0A645EPI9_9ZZZZ